MTRRVRRTLWALVVVAVAATGSLSRALAAEPGAGTGVTVAASALIVATVGFLALRILLVVACRPIPPGLAARAAGRGHAAPGVGASAASSCDTRGSGP